MRKYPFPLAALTAAALACSTFVSPVPPLAWDPGSDHVLIEYNCFGGLVPTGYYENNIPPVRIRGDGAVIWLDNTGPERRVLEGTFTQDELRAVVQRVADAGFYSWKDEYQASQMIYDGIDCRLSVALDTVAKTVWVRSGAETPAGYAELLDWLRSGAGAVGHDYVPQHGWLTSIPTSATDAPPVFVWPAEGIDGIRLGDALGALPVDGEALATAWRIVNGDRYAQVEYVGMRYTLVVQIENVTDRWPGSP